MEWTGKIARELYKRIISTMPQDDPGSLPPDEALAITTFIARCNGGAIVAARRANDLNTVRLSFTSATPACD